MDETVSFRYWKLFNKTTGTTTTGPAVTSVTLFNSHMAWNWNSQYDYAVSQGKRLPLRQEIIDNEDILKITGQDRWVAGLKTLDGGTGIGNRDWYQIELKPCICKSSCG